MITNKNTPIFREKNTASIDQFRINDRSSNLSLPKNVGKEDLFFENQLLDYKGASKYLSICESYLRRLKATGKIPFVQIGIRGIRFKIASLDSWIAEREIK